jgi:hypothetical protein
LALCASAGVAPIAAAPAVAAASMLRRVSDGSVVMTILPANNVDAIVAARINAG